MLIAEPRSIPRRRHYRWLWIAGAIAVGAVIACVALLAAFWPFTRAAMIKALEESSGRTVEIGAFSNSYFPPGCTAEGVRFLRHKHPQLTPIITIEKLVIKSSLTGLLGSPKRLSEVEVKGMHLVVAPGTSGTGRPTLLNAGPGGKAIAISRITADGAVLEFMHEDRNRKPYVLKIVHLELRGVGYGQPMAYAATLDNTEPPGRIQAKGKFGPWNPSNMGATPVSGEYTYENMELGHFEGVHGTGHARGQFSGRLGEMQTGGRVDVSGFQVDGSNHRVDLATSYQATVNGTNGDVVLKQTAAQFRRTRIEVSGAIQARGDEDGKSAALDVSIPQGRVEDLLYLFTRDEPGMSGKVNAAGKFLWPPGPDKFLEKIRLDLNIGLQGSRFTSPNTQEPIDHLSESAAGEKKKQQDEDPRTVWSEIRGGVRVRGGVATISGGRFEVPGADALMEGTYNLLNQRVDLHGTLDTRGKLADTTSGFKALAAKVVTPLFKKRVGTRIIPFQITGAYGNTTLGIDWKKRL